MEVTFEKFLHTINMFWFIALYTAKQILRNELLVAKVRESNLKELLLQMIEWHEKAINGVKHNSFTYFFILPYILIHQNYIIILQLFTVMRVYHWPTL
ncbi:aminoglycoside 6-adenylyltransferase [Clostridium lamae]|uniref:aminoglycoside 6-adenylyltransferase n=1 Tax=Clostridium TaxID=1485 RepID=UPI00374E2F91